MVKVNVSLPDFSAGEVSPELYGRHDLAAFYNGGRRVENFIVQIGGPARYRTGSIYSSKTKDNNVAFLYTFKYTDAVSYVLEFTDQALRFHQNGGRVQETAQGITGATNANPCVVTYSGSDTYSNGDYVYIYDVVGMEELNGNDYVIANVDTGANTFELQGINSTSYGTYSAGGSVANIVQITTPFAEADLFELKIAQSGADMYITHPSYNPQKLTYSSATSWSIGNHSPTALTLTANNRPRAVGFYEQRLIYASSNNSPNTIWFSKSADYGDFTTGTGATDGIQYTIAGQVNNIAWLEASDEFITTGGFFDVLRITGGQEEVITPSSISIKSTRSYGVSNIMPVAKGTQVLYLQNNKLVLRSYEYDLQFNTYRPVDRNTIAEHITSSGIKQLAFQEGRPNVVWAVKENGVLIGMTLEDQESISGWHRHTTSGLVQSIATLPRVGAYNQLWQCVKRTIDGSDVYYIEYFADKVNFPRREDYIDGAIEDSEETEATDHAKWQNLIFESQKEYIHVDSSLSYYGDKLGLDASATLTPGATTGTGITFTASASVFTSAMVGRELWRKAIDGTETGRAEITAYSSGTQVTCTVLEDFDSTDAIPAGEWYLTAGTFNNLDHLEGETVTVVADGGQHPERTVADGSIILARQASVVHVGLPYYGYLESNDLEGGGTTGVAQTKRKNVHAVGVRFVDTLYAKYGTSYYKLNQIEMRTAAMRMDRPPEIFTGDVKETYANESNDKRDAGWSREKRVIIAQDQPFPCNVQLIVPYMSVSN